MKTLILYASKYGATKEIANRIASKIDNAVVCDLKQGNLPSIADYGCIIVGSSLYAGSIRKEAKVFAAENANILAEKKLGLFLSGFAADEKYFATNYPQNLLDIVKAKAFLGGIFDPQKAVGFERFIIKLVMKQKEYVERIDDEAIARFVSNMEY
ncbi:MAG: flavodoxin domain-containing protein [Defluviitaleaceae bacterium]|nr:flavodoxin domain-containing protein [Defluviitaleaceae bacterium]